MLSIKITRVAVFALMYVVIACSAFSFASESNGSLNGISQNIQSSMKSVRDTKKQEKSLQSKVRELDRSIKMTEKEVRSYDAQILRLQNKRKALAVEIEEIDRNMESERAELKLYIREFYKRRFDNNAMLLVSADDYQDLLRKSRYVTLIASYNRRELDEYSRQRAAVGEKKQEFEKLESQLQANKKNVQYKKNDLLSMQEKKSRIFNDVRDKRTANERRLKELRRSSAELKSTVGKLQRKKIPAGITGKGFIALKGEHPWPVKGQVIEGFGENEDPDTGMTINSNGLKIASTDMAVPKSIAGGRVVYAQEFKGFDMLMIVDHGEGYHSIYGNLKDLFLQTGDMLLKGTELGTLSSSGTLYFEIRHQGRSKDPLPWLAHNSTQK
ncbi:MAG: peptidoglycan DD-metalloendopeptidase family protein [Nitrospira sp.]|nr:peptidoglycan DD-metalloendopeptidase family protein [bacterium]MBL7048245.1 peptidoglycan DD-metalloendopeptidase family protein [Nitrospira sp.]